MVVERMKNRYLNALNYFYATVKSNEEEVNLAKDVFNLIKKGKFREAANLSERNSKIAKVWEKTLENN